MASKESLLIGLLSDVIRRNPRTSAIIAFNIGAYAATALKHGVRKSDLKKLPAQLVELVPSMKDLADYVPLLTPEVPVARRRRPHRAGSRAGRRRVG